MDECKPLVMLSLVKIMSEGNILGSKQKIIYMYTPYTWIQIPFMALKLNTILFKNMELLRIFKQQPGRIMERTARVKKTT